MIVAHRLLEPGAPAGHAVGQIVAEYAFHLAGGEVVVARIRERFEIQVVRRVGNCRRPTRLSLTG